MRPLHTFPTFLAIAAAVWILASAAWARAQETPRETPVLRALMSFPRFQGAFDSRSKQIVHSDADEPDDERAARLAEIADAIIAATPHPHEQRLLLSVGWWESRYASYVHRDKPRCRNGIDGACDVGRAFGLVQIWGAERTESLEWQMSTAISLLRYHARRCGHPGLATARSVRVAVSGFATGGRTCRWPGASERVRTWRELVGRV